MANSEITPRNEDLFDHLDSTGQFNSYEMQVRAGQAFGQQAARAIVSLPEHRPTHRRRSTGGRTLNRPDTELDENYGAVKRPGGPPTEPAARAAYDEFAAASKEDAIKALIEQRGISRVHAEAIMRKRAEEQGRV